MWRLRPTVLVAAAWTLSALWRVKRRARRDGVRTRSPRPWPLPYSATPGVMAALTRVSPTCLERSLVLQAWLAAHDHPRDVVIGVPVEGIGARPAHAWVDRVDALDEDSYRIIHRVAASTGYDAAGAGS